MLRLQSIPPPPAALAGLALFQGATAALNEAAVRAALAEYQLVEVRVEPETEAGPGGGAAQAGRPIRATAGEKASTGDVIPGEGAPATERSRCLVRFETHEDAVGAVETLRATGGGELGEPALLYNQRPCACSAPRSSVDQACARVPPVRVEDVLLPDVQLPDVQLPARLAPADERRGWCVFESAVATEALFRIETHSRLKERLQRLQLPPKLLEIDTSPLQVVKLQLSEGGGVARVQGIREALDQAAFTGRADRAQVRLPPCSPLAPHTHTHMPLGPQLASGAAAGPRNAQ